LDQCEFSGLALEQRRHARGCEQGIRFGQCGNVAYMSQVDSEDAEPVNLELLRDIGLLGLL